MGIVYLTVEKSAILLKQLKKALSPSNMEWVESKISATPKELALAFVVANRKVDKLIIHCDELFKTLHEKWPLQEVSSEQLVRAYFLSLLSENASTEEEYQTWMNHLFETAEINEAVSLYKFLLVSDRQTVLLPRAKEAVRSNVGNIFDAIAFYNPYPFQYFEEAAWNQLILKCIFNDKPIHLIVGLDERRNLALAETLSDFAHERWAASRRVPSQVWRLISPFVNDILAKDVEKLLQSTDERDQLAAILVIKESNHNYLKTLLTNNLDAKFGAYSWSTLENNEPIYTGQEHVSRT